MDASASFSARFRSGVTLLPRAGQLLRRHRALWGLAGIPALLTTFCVTAAASAVLANAGPLLDAIAAVLPRFEVTAWYQWLWLGPATAGVWLATVALFGLAIGLAALAGLLFATLLASPVLDELSRRVERVVGGHAAGDGEAFRASLFARDVLSSLGNEARRLALLLGLWAAVGLLALVLPGGVALTPFAFAVIAVVFLPLEYAGFALDRRRVSFARRRSWLAGQRARALGFGAAAFAVGLVPGLNFVMLPVLIVAGTLFVTDAPPPNESAGADGETLGSGRRRRG